MARLNKSNTGNEKEKAKEEDKDNDSNHEQSTQSARFKSTPQQKSTQPTSVKKTGRGQGEGLGREQGQEKPQGRPRGRPRKQLSHILTTTTSTSANTKKYKDIENNPSSSPFSNTGSRTHTRTRLLTSHEQSRNQLFSNNNFTAGPSSNIRTRKSRTSQISNPQPIPPSTPTKRNAQQPLINLTPDPTSNPTSTSTFTSLSSASPASPTTSSSAFIDTDIDGSPISHVPPPNISHAPNRTILQTSIKELKETCSSQNSNSIRSQWIRLQNLHEDSQDSLSFPIFILHHTSLNLAEIRFAIETCEEFSWEEIKKKKFKHASQLVYGLVEAFNLEGWWQLYLWFGRGTIESRLTLQAIKAFVKDYQRKKTTAKGKGGRRKNGRGKESDIEMFHGWLHEARMKRQRGSKISRDLSKFIVADIKKARMEICPWTKKDKDGKKDEDGEDGGDEEESRNGEDDDTGAEGESQYGGADNDTGDEGKARHGEAENAEDEDGWYDVSHDESITDASLNAPINAFLNQPKPNLLVDESFGSGSASMDLTNVPRSTELEAKSTRIQPDPTGPIETEEMDLTNVAGPKGTPSKSMRPTETKEMILNESTIEVEMPRKGQVEMGDRFDDSFPPMDSSVNKFEEDVDESFIFNLPDKFTTAEQEIISNGQMDTTMVVYEDLNSLDVRYKGMIDICSDSSDNEASDSRFKNSRKNHSSLDTSEATKVLQFLHKPCQWTDEILELILRSFPCHDDIRILHPLAFPLYGMGLDLFSIRKYFDYKIILVPIHHPEKAPHWSLVVIEPRQSYFKHYDSVPSASRWKLVENGMKKWLKKQNAHCEWRLAEPMGKCIVGSRQKDSVSCGLFVAGWCWNIMLGVGGAHENDMEVFDEDEIRRVFAHRIEGMLKGGDVDEEVIKSGGVDEKRMVTRRSNFAKRSTDNKLLVLDQSQQGTTDRMSRLLRICTGNQQVDGEGEVDGSGSVQTLEKFDGEGGEVSLEVSPITSLEGGHGDGDGYEQECGERKGVMVEGFQGGLGRLNKGGNGVGSGGGEGGGEGQGENEEEVRGMEADMFEDGVIKGMDDNVLKGCDLHFEARGMEKARLVEVDHADTKSQEDNDDIINLDSLSTIPGEAESNTKDTQNPTFKEIVESHKRMKRKYREFTREKERMDIMIQRKRTKVEEENKRVERELKKLERERGKGEEMVRLLRRLEGDSTLK